MGDHDHSYKLLFAHPRMVRELLETFVGGDWVAEVDFDSLERVSDNYISDDLRARADDMVWRVRCGNRHVYLLIEFQSRVDTFMAVRVMAYVALLYQDVIRTQQITADEGLPAILPVVLHNGSARWRAAEDLGSLLQPLPVGIEKFGANIRYILVDEGRYDDAALARHDNFVASLFRLEQCRELERVEVLVGDLIGKLNASGEESLRRAFAAWLEKVVLRRLAGERTTISDLRESKTMLSERFDEWEAQFRREGMQEGLKKGEAALLTRQLQRRFGELPNSVHTRLHGARIDEIESWGERLLEVSSLEELFTEERDSFPLKDGIGTRDTLNSR
jgi:hypothetical protein